MINITKEANYRVYFMLKDYLNTVVNIKNKFNSNDTTIHIQNILDDITQCKSKTNLTHSDTRSSR